MIKRVLLLILCLGFAVTTYARLIRTEYAKVVVVRKMSTYAIERQTYFQLEGIKDHKKCKSDDWGKGELTIWQVPDGDRRMQATIEQAERENRYVQITSNDSYTAKGEGGICQAITVDVSRPQPSK